jgi:hypothetical protein
MALDSKPRNQKWRNHALETAYRAVIDHEAAEVVEEAARNSREVKRLLLDRRGDEIQITDSVVKAVAGNKESGETVMRLLLDRRGDNV